MHIAMTDPNGQRYYAESEGEAAQLSVVGYRRTPTHEQQAYQPAAPEPEQQPAAAPVTEQDVTPTGEVAHESDVAGEAGAEPPTSIGGNGSASRRR